MKITEEKRDVARAVSKYLRLYGSQIGMLGLNYCAWKVIKNPIIRGVIGLVCVDAMVSNVLMMRKDMATASRVINDCLSRRKDDEENKKPKMKIGFSIAED